MLKHLQTRLYSAVRNLIREELALREEEESKNIQLELQRRALQTTADYVERRMANVDSVPTRFKLLDLALSRSVPNGLYCEFGVFSAASINYIARHTARPVYGFPPAAVSVDLKATAEIPGVLEDLAAFVTRVEAIPALVYEGLVRNASFREDQLCSLYYMDTMGSRALGSVKALDRWIAQLLARKQTVRATLARRLREVFGSAQRHL